VSKNKKTSKKENLNKKLELPKVETKIPGKQSKKIIKKNEKFLNSYIIKNAQNPYVIKEKRNSLIVDADNNTYIDMISGWGVNTYGTAPKQIKKAMEKTWDKYGMEISGFNINKPALKLAENLTKIAPKPLTRVEYSVTGTLAVEGAIKYARDTRNRPRILVFGDTYHGESTYLTASLSTENAGVSSGSAQYISGLVHIPYPNPDRSPFRKGYGPHDDTEVLEYLERWVLKKLVEPEEISAVLIEPVLTEMGAIKPSQNFWNELTKLCKTYNWLLITDEVQTGMGRCGEKFAVQLFDNIQPDLMPLGKGLSAGGQPIAAILGTEQTLGNSHQNLGSTFGWVPAACAGANEGLKLLEKATQNAKKIETQTLKQLKYLEEKYQFVGKVRAVGAEIAIEFIHENKKDYIPWPEMQTAVHKEALKLGVAGISETSKSCYRLQPELTMNLELYSHGLNQIEKAIKIVNKNKHHIPKKSKTNA
jgi:4-aminobutyrate aminotransferase-like enzyme